MSAPIPQPSGSRGRVPPSTPTAVGLMERPEPWPREPASPWWRRCLSWLVRLFIR